MTQGIKITAEFLFPSCRGLLPPRRLLSSAAIFSEGWLFRREHERLSATASHVRRLARAAVDGRTHRGELGAGRGRGGGWRGGVTPQVHTPADRVLIFSTDTYLTAEQSKRNFFPYLWKKSLHHFDNLQAAGHIDHMMSLISHQYCSSSWMGIVSDSPENLICECVQTAEQTGWHLMQEESIMFANRLRLVKVLPSAVTHWVHTVDVLKELDIWLLQFFSLSTWGTAAKYQKHLVMGSDFTVRAQWAHWCESVCAPWATSLKVHLGSFEPWIRLSANISLILDRTHPAILVQAGAAVSWGGWGYTQDESWADYYPDVRLSLDNGWSQRAWRETTPPLR